MSPMEFLKLALLSVSPLAIREAPLQSPDSDRW
jgi:hypothetical protein